MHQTSRRTDQDADGGRQSDHWTAHDIYMHQDGHCQLRGVLTHSRHDSQRKGENSNAKEGQDTEQRSQKNGGVKEKAAHR